MATKTVLFVHGNFVNHRCWDRWVNRYEAQGYTCIAVPYPGRDKSVEALRKAHPDPKVSQLGLDEVLDHHVRIIKRPTPPEGARRGDGVRPPSQPQRIEEEESSQGARASTSFWVAHNSFLFSVFDLIH